MGAKTKAATMAKEATVRWACESEPGKQRAAVLDYSPVGTETIDWNTVPR